jgi:hypothetical protein
MKRHIAYILEIISVLNVTTVLSFPAAREYSSVLNIICCEM